MIDQAAAGPYSIGSSVWPGVSKVIEESGELCQVLGKLLGCGGETQHWDGSDLAARLIEEMGDLQAALDYLTEANSLDADAIAARRAAKLAVFRKWHAEAAPLPDSIPA